MTEQVADRPELLQLMLDDLAASPAAFKPTNYWSVYERRFLPELVARGLRDFRRRHESVLSSFGATDFRPRGAYVDLSRSRVFGNRVTQHLPGWKRLLSRLNDVLNRDGMSAVRLDVYECGLRELQESAFRLTQLYGEHAGARALDSIELSSAGNPEDVFEIAGRAYTMRALYYYLRYAYCCQFVDFDEIDLMVELGSGMGRQIEIVRKLHPRIRVIAFDIPPQLYVCSQFLSAVFPDAVIGYETTRTYRALPDLPAGAIAICGTWLFPLLRGRHVDLFWNAVSFQEMEPDIVANYLSYVAPTADAVYLQERMDGKELSRAKGEPGVLRQTTLEDYRRGLPNHTLVDMSTCLRPLGTLPDHRDSFWVGRTGPDNAGQSRIARPPGRS